MTKNSITPTQHGVQVVLDPHRLLRHAACMPDGETIIKSNMTIGQLIEAIAFAHIKQKLPQCADKCSAATIKFENGKFHVTFADHIDHLTF